MPSNLKLERHPITSPYDIKPSLKILEDFFDIKVKLIDTDQEDLDITYNKKVDKRTFKSKK